MSDLISRQAAIDIADDLRTCISVEGYWAWTERLKKLPSADAVPVKHGKWEKVKYDDDDGYFYLYVHKDCGCEQARERKYCPNCGAKMDGGKDDEEQV